jgi:Uma2 family endonuclease
MTASIAKFTVDDYHQMIDAGILGDRRVELIDGLILEMPPEGTEHTYYGETLAQKFRRLLTEERAWVRENKPITLSTSEPEPDLAVVRLPRSHYLQHHPYREDIFLLVEVSKSTLKFDISEKKKIYALSNISEYWVVDVENKKLLVYRYPETGNYRETTELLEGEKIAPLAFRDLEMAIAEIFEP